MMSSTGTRPRNAPSLHAGGGASAGAPRGRKADPHTHARTQRKPPPPSRVISIDRPKLLTRARETGDEQSSETTLGDLQERFFGKSRTRWRPSAAGAGDDSGDGDGAAFANNVVVSAKYTLWNFVPRVLLAQVKRPSNIYFLFIAVLQTIKEVSNTNGVPTILLPLVIVFICSAIKEALEDRERHRADAIMNSKEVLCLSAMGEWEMKQWGDVQVGDIVKVLNDETVPADLFMLSTEELEDPDADVIESRDATQEDSTENDQEKYQQIDLSGTNASATPAASHSSGGGHLAYIETKSLDGETNLKIRTAIPLVAMLSKTLSDLLALRGTIECEAPNNRIATFDGSFSVELNNVQASVLGLNADAEGEISSLPRAGQSSRHLQRQVMTKPDGSRSIRVPITAKQMVLRSCVLRNTRSIVGIAIFTGHETKVFCSNTDPVVKTSSVEQRLNTLIIGVVFIQQLVCLLGALLGAYWMITQGRSYWYLRGESVDSTSAEYFRGRHAHDDGSFPFQELIKLHLRYFIIMQNFVPISLNVSLEFVKYWQAYFIEQDLEMYDDTSDTPALVRSSALNEDLGRVHHIFTDKTGTLTMNLMLFRFCMINGKHYGGEVQESEIGGTPSSASALQLTKNQDKRGGSPFVNFDPTDLFTDLRAGGSHADQIRLFLRHLALCHTLIPAKPLKDMCASPSPEYSASSPDEQALVSAAAHCNVRFVHRTPSAMMIMEPGFDEPSTYKILHLLEFDSDRKRMSVILETPEGEIELLCKGADNVILERLTPTDDPAHVDKVYDQLSLYAKCGMRTLCLAYKKLDRAEYAAWNTHYVSATSSMDELVKRRQGLPNAIDPLMNEIEQNLTLLGVTAVQDKLQDGVPSTLQLLRQTHMKIWTLTGDKMETAINIGYACSMLTSKMEVLQVSSEDYVAVARGLQDAAMRQEKLLAKSRASRLREAKRQRRMGRVTNATWYEQWKASLSTFLFGVSLKKKHSRGRLPIRQAGLRGSGTYSPVSTLEYDDLEGDDADDSLLWGSGPLAGFDTPNGSSSSLPSLALVIDGKSLEHALRPRLRPLFYQVTKMCTSVICCRVSPKQKADIVEFVRHYEPESITLAIGDGANDVGMIQAAHIGVGISGQEGMQAVNSSDYAIGQFRFLQRLLFVHGRWAYRRVTKLMSYMLYKNVTYVLTTFWFGCFCGFSGQPLILDVAAQSFNVLYTSLPLVLFAVFDQDISSQSASKFPYLYSLGQKNVLLTRKVFWPWILNGVWHSVIIFFISAWGFQGDLSLSTHRVHHPATVSSNGQEDGLITLGFVVFTNLVIVVNLKLVLETFMVTWHFLTVVFASVALWFAVGTLISSPTSHFRQAVGELTYLEHLPTFWALCFLVVTLSLMRDLLWKIVRRMNFPSTYHILQEREMLSMTNSPRSMRNEYKGLMWPDVQVPILDYAKMLRQIPPFESAQESFIRSSPLAESLISTNGGGGTDTEARHIRSRASFHVSGSYDDDEYGFWEEGHGLHHHHSFDETHMASPAKVLDAEVQRSQYHGYAFSEDENVDSDVEAASAKQAALGQQVQADEL
uniref:Phospholipid-transporting ATPase n=1 Tax=Globisporangium ultimum (strain ATCC 200006 / CBS 805.95 / DAOM BR144) TaxID=431595 RepID=K3WGR7_GLOUD